MILEVGPWGLAGALHHSLAFVMFENIPNIQLEWIVGPPGGGRHSLPLPACLWVCPAGPRCSQLGIPFGTLYPSRVLRTKGAEKPKSRDPQTPAPSWAQLHGSQHLARLWVLCVLRAGEGVACARAELYVWGTKCLSGAGIHLQKQVGQEVTEGEQKSSTKCTGPRGHLEGF